MFSSSVAGAGSICLGCQLRAVTHRATVLAAAAATTTVAASSAVPAAAQSSIRRRYASNSSDAGSSNDDFFERVLNAQKHDDRGNLSKPTWDVSEGASAKEKPKRERPGVLNRRATEAYEKGEVFQRTFTDPSLREATFTGQEVTWEDVYDQDPNPEKGVRSLERDAVKKRKADRARLLEENPDEISFGVTTHDQAPSVGNFSWNQETAAEIKEKYAHLKKESRPAELAPLSWVSRPFPRLTTYEWATSRIKPKPVTDDTDDWDVQPEETSAEAAERRARIEKELQEMPKAQATEGWTDWDEGSSAAQAQSEEPFDPFADFATSTEFEASEAPKHYRETHPSTKSEASEASKSWTTPQETTGPELRYYRKGSQKLVESSGDMSIPTLGKNQPVIILREDGRWKNDPLPRDPEKVDRGQRMEDLAEQQEGLSLDVVLENIEEVRPPSKILPAREYKTIFDVLMRGFTSIHLEAYIGQQRKRQKEGDETSFIGDLPDPDETMARPWIVSHRRWTPDVKDAVEDVAHPLKGYILTSMPPKQRLVMQLMRECWGMSVQELLQGHGTLDIEMRDVEFRLLTLGERRHIHEITRKQLAPGGGKAIEVIQSRKALRIVGPKAVSEVCLRSMDEIFQKIKTKTVSLANTPTPSAQTLEELGQLTNCLLEYDKDSDQLHVTWLDTNNRKNPKLEDLGDIVLRLILTTRPPARTENALEVYTHSAEKPKLIQDWGSKDKLLWIDRRLAWARLCLPLAIKAQPQHTKKWPLRETLLKYKIEPDTDDYIERKSKTKEKVRAYSMTRHATMAGVPLTFPRPRALTEEQLLDETMQPTKPTLSGWLPFRVRTQAVFGHVLHINHKNAQAELREKGTDSLTASRRALSPIIPPVTEMALPGWVPYRSERSVTAFIVMRFNPFLDPSAATAGAPNTAPTLELRLSASDDEVVAIDSLRAIAHTHVADICLPSEVVDVRATQRLVAELPGDKLDSTPGLKPLAQFLQDSYLEPAQGRLITPPVLNGLALPQWLFYAPEVDLQSSFLRKPVLGALYDAAKAATDGSSPSTDTALTKKKPSKKPKKSAKTNPLLATTPHNPYLESANAPHPTPISYLFAGLEVHRPIETAYDGWKLTYTSIEAGAGGGRRAELALTARPAADTSLRRPMETLDAAAWLKSVYRLAAGKAGQTSRREDADEELDAGLKGVVRWFGLKN